MKMWILNNMRVKSEKREFKVGDKIVKKNWYGTTTLKVTRVTKTQAICEVKRADGTGYVDKYRKEYYFWLNFSVGINSFMFIV